MILTATDCFILVVSIRAVLTTVADKQLEDALSIPMTTLEFAFLAQSPCKHHVNNVIQHTDSQTGMQKEGQTDGHPGRHTDR